MGEISASSGTEMLCFTQDKAQHDKGSGSGLAELGQGGGGRGIFGKGCSWLLGLGFTGFSLGTFFGNGQGGKEVLWCIAYILSAEQQRGAARNHRADLGAMLQGNTLLDRWCLAVLANCESVYEHCPLRYSTGPQGTEALFAHQGAGHHPGWHLYLAGKVATLPARGVFLPHCALSQE